MLLIDKSKQVTVFTIGANAMASPAVNMAITNSFTKVTKLIVLPADLSEYPSRYSQYQFQTEVFDDLQPGRYVYKLSNQTQVLAEGVLQVIGVPAEDDNQAEVIVLSSEEDEHVVYK